MIFRIWCNSKGAQYAETEYKGEIITVQSNTSATAALCRKLVGLKAKDARIRCVNKHSGDVRYYIRSLKHWATMTVVDSDKTGIRIMKWVPPPEHLVAANKKY